MEQFARNNDISNTATFVAEIKSNLEGKHILVDEYGRVAKATVAASCLVNPNAGDLVFAVSVGETVYILAVLDRANTTSTKIEIDGDVMLSVPSGKLEIDAQAGLNLSTPESLVMAAGLLGLSLEALAAAFQKVDIFGDLVQFNATDIKLHAKQFRSRIESAIQKYVRRHASIDTVDSLNTGTLKQTVKDIWAHRSAFAFLRAKKNVKIDGKQIFMG